MALESIQLIIAATEMGIIVTNNPTYCVYEVAEHSRLPISSGRVHCVVLSSRSRSRNPQRAKTKRTAEQVHGADQRTRGAVWTVAGENDHAAVSNERYVGSHG